MERLIQILRKNIYVVYGLLLLLTVAFIVLNNKYTFFWFDEGFSLGMIKHPYGAIWDFTAKDVHPPLYYFMLKVYASLTNDSVLNLRFFSAVPVFLTVVVACTMIRKYWGNRVAVLFIVLLLVTPITYFMTSEIRMYSWAMFFVLMSFLYAYRSYTGQQKRSFLLMAMFSLLAAYTHYYALITVAYIYLLFFVLLFINDRKKIPWLLASALVCVLVYAPWLVNLISQVKTVTKDFWITSTWFNNAMEFLYPVYIIQFSDYSFLYSRVVEILIPVTFFLFIMWRVWRQADNKKRLYQALAILSIFFAPTVIGGLYSIIFRPVFISRYMCCFIGLYFLGFAIVLSMLDLHKKLNVVIPALALVCLLMLDAYTFKDKLRTQRNRSMKLDAMVAFVEEDLDDNVAFLYRDYFYFPLAYYTTLFPDYTHISKSDSIGDTVSYLADVFSRKKVKSYADIDSTYTRIYVLETIPARAPSITQSKEDWDEITKYYDVMREIDLSYSLAYELKRKGVVGNK